METKKIRVRFAPAPTGMMHLGNVRTALLNYLFAKKMGGAFVVRIEDTDQERNIDPTARRIVDDLAWLGLAYDEGPFKGGPHTPYFQSQRTELYQEWLKKMQDGGFIYRCFCTQEELEHKRARQIALKQPPRYDRTCLHLSQTEVKQRLAAKIPFLWRMRLDLEPTLQITDLARGQITFDMQHFSDFALTRQDGTFTFMFANFVDDATMHMSHVIRGEDHLTNTAGQAAMYSACKLPTPIFWHLSIICNIDGKKLSKRDFGFSLQDLKNEGFLPEAIDNYLAIIGGGSFEHEVMDLATLVNTFDTTHLHATSQIRYDVQKLRWLNHKWIARLTPEDIAERALPFVQEECKNTYKIDKTLLTRLIKPVMTDLTTLKEVAPAIRFYFERPNITAQRLQEIVPAEHIQAIAALFKAHLAKFISGEQFIHNIKQDAHAQKMPLKTLFATIRVGLMGTAQGPAIQDLIGLLDTQETLERLQRLDKTLKQLAE